MDQEQSPASPPEGDAPADAMRPPRPPRVVPFGGSKWAAMFAGARAAPAAAVAGEPLRPGAVDAEGRIDSAPASGTAAKGAGFWAETGGSLALGMLATDVLPGWLPARRELPGLVLCGPAPTPAEIGLLTALGLIDQYQAPGRPRRFAQLLVPGPLPAHAAPVDEDTLTLLARLRPPLQPGAPGGVAILPRPGRRFSLRNQASVIAWLRARRVPVLDADQAAFAQTAARLAAATLVLIAEPAQAGLLAFCQPGTRVVELAAEGWAGARTRTICAALGLNWRLFLGGPPTYPVSVPLPFGAPAPMAYEISIALLSKALTLL